MTNGKALVQQVYGPIPDDWVVARLRRVADVIMGQSPPSSDYNAKGEGAPFLQGNADFGRHHPDPTVHCATATKYSRAGDILLSVRAPVGALNTADQVYGIGRGLCAIRGRPDLLETHFLRYALEAGRGMLQARSTGSTYDAVAANDVRDWHFPLPPLQDQRAIADFLDERLRHLDHALKCLDRQITRLADYRTARITEALTGRASASGARVEDGLDDRTVVRLRYLISKPLSYGVLKPIRSDAEDSVPLVRTCDVTEHGRVLRDRLITIASEQAREYRRTRLEEGDVAVSVVGTIGRSFIVNSELAGANVSRALARISTGSRVLSAWVDMYIRSHIFKARAGLIAGGTAQKVLNMGDLADFPIPVPPVAEQRRTLKQLESVLATMDEVEDDLRRQRKRFRQLRRAMVSSAVCGRMTILSQGPK